MVSQIVKDSSSSNQSITGVDEVEYQELDLTKPAGLNLFQESLIDVSVSVAAYKAFAKAEDFKSLALDDVSGLEIFQIFIEKIQDLQKNITECRDVLLPNGDDISDQRVDIMQALYDDVILLRNHILDTYEELVAQPAEDEKPQIIENTQEKKSVNKKPAHTEKPSYAENQQKPIPQTKNEREEKPQEVKIETKQEEVELPSEVEISSLMRGVFENQFLVPSERNQALAIYEDFNRSVASGDEITKSLNIFRQLKDLINKFANDPDFHILAERATKILEHVSATNETPDNILQIAIDLFEEVKDAEVNSTHDKQPLLKAYKQLEIFAVKHESDWLSVCGVRVPVAGQAGLKQARKLREVLMVERDKHAELRCCPEKQILVDKLVRKLANISDDGLDFEKDIPELKRLVHLVDVPQSQNSSDKEAFKKDDYVVSISRKQSKVMQIVEDNDEGSILIEVAKDTEKTIASNQTQTESTKVHGKDDNETPAKSINHVLVNKNFSRDELSMVAEVELNDPINKAVVEEIPTKKLPKQNLRENDVSHYQGNKKYQQYIQSNFKSLKAFNKRLNNTILQIEASTMDPFERWLGEQYNSAFEYLKDMHLSEIEGLVSSSGTRNKIIAENIKYETFLTWIDLIPEMKDAVKPNSDLAFGELYAGWVIEFDLKNKSFLKR